MFRYKIKEINGGLEDRIKEVDGFYKIGDRLFFSDRKEYQDYKKAGIEMEKKLAKNAWKSDKVALSKIRSITLQEVDSPRQKQEISVYIQAPPTLPFENTGPFSDMNKVDIVARRMKWISSIEEVERLTQHLSKLSSWVDLYRLKEFIFKSDYKSEPLHEKSDSSEYEHKYERFNDTCNNTSALGLEARHSSKHDDAKELSDPMSEREAKRWITDCVLDWLSNIESKHSEDA